jgi:hypothetical protein
MKWVVKRYWEFSDSVEVEADSVEQAIKVAHALPIPHGQAEFVPDSLNSDPVVDVQPLQRRPHGRSL